MKRLWLLTLLIVPLWAAIPQGVLRSNLNIIVQYPTNQLSTNPTTFKIYSSVSLTIPMTNWAVWTNFVVTNQSTGTFYFPFPPAAQVVFFSVTASNLWGESPFSPSVAAPLQPTNGQISIQ